MKGETMQGKYTGAIRGLSIATIALSAIWLLGCLFSVIILAMTGSAFGGGFMESLSYELMYDSSYYYDPLFAEGIGTFVSWTIGILAVVLGWETLTCLVSLVAGILGLRNAANVAKLGSVFGWGIAGAVAALLGGRLITMALLIIAAVLAKKTQDAASVAHWQNVAAQQGQPYGHNMYAQPAPAQGYAPVNQPTNYQQTYAPQQPTAQQPVYPAQPVQQPVAQAYAQPTAQVVQPVQPMQVAQAAAPVEAAPATAIEAATPEPIAELAAEPATTEPVAAESVAAEPVVTREPLDEVGEDAKAYDPETASYTEVGVNFEPEAIPDAERNALVEATKGYSRYMIGASSTLSKYFDT
ncbi:MAG: hypothetical protein IJ993_10680, partial [Akkermansia sp.]|nr:hypothetical protein [Akkermansia sp.]